MQGVKINILGKKFNSLTVIRFSHKMKPHIKMWECVCDCGTFITVRGQSLREGHTKSCGCLLPKVSTLVHTTHGQTKDGIKSPEMISWSTMKQRCYNPKATGYKNYGGKGITVCKRWLNSFSNFLLDMGKRPSLNHSLDRINGTGNYTKKNCRWATKKEQARNTARNIWIDFNGEKIIQAELCCRLQVEPANFISMRKNRSVQEAITFYLERNGRLLEKQ